MTAVQGRRKRGTGHELRDVIVRESTALLAERGDVDALTMRAVATAAGVTAPSVYRHFPDKQALVRTVITERFDEFTNVLTAALSSAGDLPWTRLEAITRAYVRWGVHQQGHYRILFSATNAGPAALGLESGAVHPGVASFRLLIESVAACLSPLGRDQAMRLSTELWASLHGIVDLRITKPEFPWPEDEVMVSTALVAVRASAIDGAALEHPAMENP